jgi:hypothetical protein
MTNFSNKTQVAYAAAVWVFGGDRYLSGEEKTAISEAFNGSRTPWSLDPYDENAKWVHSLYSSGKIMNLDDIIYAIDNEFNFTLQEKYQLYWCVCVPMHALGQGKNSEDGWGRANILLEALGIDNDEYNSWAKQ